MQPKGSQEIAGDIARDIALGKYGPSGAKLPTTRFFVEKYDTSNTTIYDAFLILKIRGIIRSVRGGRRYVV